MTDLVYHAVAKVADLGEGEMMPVTIGKRSIALYHLDGAFYATDAFCSHGHALLTDGYIEGALIECPMHGGTFEIRSGKAVGEPCVTALATYPVKVEDETISIGVSDSAAA
jgi:nitrite reductase/ring-hydroxylating ferredoxin subunit